MLDHKRAFPPLTSDSTITPLAKQCKGIKGEYRMACTHRLEQRYQVLIISGLESRMEGFSVQWVLSVPSVCRYN